ncbi:MAG: hypothetical protein MUF54_15455 [Polyangiaceae bacterium]|nr:hypothetical protein [Polyangiaceae bacterium]
MAPPARGGHACKLSIVQAPDSRGCANDEVPGPDDAAAQGATATTGSESGPVGAPDAVADSFPKVEPKDSGKHQLDAAAVKETVAAYRPHLGEVCWDPHVKKQPDGPDPVRVAIEVEVLPDGKVQSVRAVGGKEYEGMAPCVQRHVQRWQFPLAKQRSTLMFPIVFSRSETKVIQVR